MIRKLALSTDLLPFVKEAITLETALDERPYLAVCTADAATPDVKRRYKWLHLVVVKGVDEGIEFLKQLGVYCAPEGNSAPPGGGDGR